MILVRLALRNLWLHKVKTLIVGSILALGTALVIVGSGLLDAVDRGMETSLVNSVSAHIQLHSVKGKDDFLLFGNMDGSLPDIGRIEDFPKVRRVIESLDNVETVVPMGLHFAVTTTGNVLERKLAELRRAVNESDAHRIGVLARQVRRTIEVMTRELKSAEALIDMDRYRREHGDKRDELARAQSDAFWQHFAEQPLDALEFLDNEIGPLAFAEDIIWVRYIGTDTELFQRTFDRFEIVDGEMIPPGQRGFLFNKFIYEEFIKNKTARRLDKIKERLDEGQTIAGCEDCQTWIRHNINQAAYLAFQLDEDAARKVGDLLRQHLGSSKKDIVALLRAFLQMDDQTFAARFELFYREIAPHILLYSVAIGDEFVLTAFGSGGYARKVPVKVYGTFRFRSLDRSPLAGGFNLMDIISFRDLYGYMTAERRREQDKIRRAAGVSDVTREQADAMFEEDGLVEEGQTESFDATKEVDFSLGGQRYTEAIHQRVYSKRELHDGVVLNAAVMLRDGDRLDESLAAIRAAIAEHDLGLEATAWRPASGVVGQLITVLSAVLYGAVFIIFVVALIIINNSLLMSTMERTVEIGTMRAIGAQRGFVMRMFLVETGVLAAIFGGIGAALGAAVMLLLERVGIPALSNFFYFLFAGPRLHPPLQGAHVVAALVLIAIVALISTFYPARVATQITPRQAMASEE